VQINMQTQADINAEAEKKRRNTRVSEIIAELEEIDKRKVRPLSVITLGKSKKNDMDKLNTLEAQATKLRLELNNLK
jgi:radical SAM superfamily enzyme YgiQ (UPF0313 family)